ncbi:MAG: ABC transporter permease subunit [Oscillospiraceae bacterium]|nr:ABC transporter permease subunit [Oscillospiraceae bacterium]
MKANRFFIVFPIFFAILNLPNFGEALALNEASRTRDEIVVGLDVNVPPMGFMDENGEIVGSDIDLAKAVFSKMGKKVVFQPIDWDAKELELETGKIDVIWNGLSKTQERGKNMLLTKPYMKNRQIVVVNRTFEIDSLKDLDNKIVCVQKGSTGADALRNHDISKGVKEIIELENMVNCLNEVETFKSDATVVDEVVVEYYLNKKGLSSKFKILSEELSAEDYVVAVKKGNFELKNEIERQLALLKSSGEGAKISKKWFDTDLFTVMDLEDGAAKGEKKAAKQSKFVNFSPILQGSAVTLKLFFVVIIFSFPLGLLLCVVQTSKRRFLRAAIRVYTNLMRGTPLLLQLFFSFYGLQYVPVIGKYLTFKSRFVAGALTFIINYAAYFVEIFRSGFLGIDKGQSEAAKVLGFSKSQTLFKILLPQLIRITLPTVCNECVTLIKDTALIFAIGVTELLTTAKNIVNSTANVTSYVIAGGVYLLTCFVVVWIFRKLEDKFSFGKE